MDDDKYITKLQQKIVIELEHKQATEELLKETRKLRLAEDRRFSIVHIVFERVAGLSGQLDSLLKRFEYSDDVLREFINDYSRGQDRIERAILLLFARRANGEERKLYKELEKQQEVSSLKRQLIQYQQNLHYWKEQTAREGRSLKAQNEIDSIERKIEEIEEQLQNENG